MFIEILITSITETAQEGMKVRERKRRKFVVISEIHSEIGDVVFKTDLKNIPRERDSVHSLCESSDRSLRPLFEKPRSGDYFVSKSVVSSRGFADFRYFYPHPSVLSRCTSERSPLSRRSHV